MISAVSAGGLRPGAGPDTVASSHRSRPRADEAAEIQRLRSRDREVRAHEQAHVAAAGPYAGRVSYSYTVGPDGRRYATGGEVSIDASPIEGDPRATLRKAQIVRRAALAPAEPSGQDMGVAAAASAAAAEARQELARAASAYGSEPDPLYALDRTA